MHELPAFVAAHEQALLWVSLASLAMFVGSLLLLPWLVARAPEDFFVRTERVRRTPLALTLAVLRNLLGLMLMVVGVLMLVLPGQGLLTMLLGFALVDGPGKRTVIRLLAQRPPLWRALTYLRVRARKPPFIKP